ncbi:class A/C sortase [Lactococcus protaetiae]|uniref:Class A/C sortase n=2 Tax=Lactococcus protaetiae TaxID=2592653 RepID=A0A514Z9A0_9LACT|nr:class A/C sortase [Lactococcus protaetiae]
MNGIISVIILFITTRKGETMRKKKIPVLLVAAIIFIFVGIGALVYPIVGDYFANQQRSTAVAHYDNRLEKISKSDIEQKLKDAQEYNDNIFAQQQGEVAPYPNIKYKNTINVGGVMATLDIPAIDIKNMPVFHGTNELTLNDGLGHFQPSSVPIGGKNTRAVIAGHSGLQNQVLFTNVRNLQVGDIFYINVLKKKLAYQIQSMDEVLPSQVDKVKIIPGKDMVTLVTCTPPGINTYRLLVNGVRIPYSKAQKEKVTHRDMFSYTKVVIASLSLCILLFIIILILYRILKGQYNQAVKMMNEGNRETSEKRLRRLFKAVKILFITLIIVMVAVLGFTIYGYTQIQHQRQMNSIEVGKTEQLSNYNLDKINRANYTESDVTSVGIGNYAEAKINFNQTVNDWGVGKIVIPSQQINLPILAGMNNDNLLNGAATYSVQQQLGKGNYVLLAHNIPNNKGESSPVLLGKINKLKKGDVIYASDFKNVYVYKVTTNQVVKETETQYIEQPQDRRSGAMITLIRCEGGMGTQFRRVVQGDLVKKESLNQLDNERLKDLGMSRTASKLSSEIYTGSSYSSITVLGMRIAAAIINNPMQTLIPIVLLLMVPILFLNLL